MNRDLVLLILSLVTWGIGVGIVSLNHLLGQLKSYYCYLITQIAVFLYAAFVRKCVGFPWYALGDFFLAGFKDARSLAAAQVRALVSSALMEPAYGLTSTLGATTTIFSPLLAGYLYQHNPGCVRPA